MTVQIKICGLTNPDEAVACSKMGADAIGLVFYPKSPRNVSIETAKTICGALPRETVGVGVFVNETFDYIMERVTGCGLKGVQLHGKEPPDLVLKLKKQNILVIKALYMNDSPAISDASSYGADAFLVECSRGILPGGNARTWDYKAAAELHGRCPFIIAGGLSPDNIKEAVMLAKPDAVDVSSGVEKTPGTKDLSKVRLFMENVKAANANTEARSIFK